MNINIYQFRQKETTVVLSKVVLLLGLVTCRRYHSKASLQRTREKKLVVHHRSRLIPDKGGTWHLHTLEYSLVHKFVNPHGHQPNTAVSRTERFEIRPILCFLEFNWIPTGWEMNTHSSIPFHQALPQQVTFKELTGETVPSSTPARKRVVIWTQLFPRSFLPSFPEARPGGRNEERKGRRKELTWP